MLMPHSALCHGAAVAKQRAHLQRMMARFAEQQASAKQEGEAVGLLPLQQLDKCIGLAAAVLLEGLLDLPCAPGIQLRLLGGGGGGGGGGAAAASGAGAACGPAAGRGRPSWLIALLQVALGGRRRPRLASGSGVRARSGCRAGTARRWGSGPSLAASHSLLSVLGRAAAPSAKPFVSVRPRKEFQPN